MKIVSESIKDILKPKSFEEIRGKLKNIIFWKGIIDNKMSPENLKYFLDKSFIQQKAKELNLKKQIVNQTDKKMVYIFDILKNRPDLWLDDDLMMDLTRLVTFWDEKNYKTSFNIIKKLINNEYKKINNRYFKFTGKNLRENLNEEKIGDYRYKNRSGEIFFTEMYKNPLSIKRMDSGIRAVSDKEGNLFVFDTAHLLHGRLLNYLHERGIMVDAKWNPTEEFYDNMVSWHRVKNTNKFYLGESYDENKDSIYLPRVQEWIKKVKEKNPQFDFVEELIYDYDRTIY